MQGKDLVLAAIRGSGTKGLCSTDFPERIRGVAKSTVRTYASQLVKEGVLVRKYEEIPGYPNHPHRARYWGSEFSPEVAVE